MGLLRAHAVTIGCLVDFLTVTRCESAVCLLYILAFLDFPG